MSDSCRVFKHRKVARSKIGVVGFCIGGQDADARSLARAKEIRGGLLMIFRTKDPHVPDAGRETIDRALRESGVRYETLLYPAEHVFTRDEGPGFDPEATDQAFAEMVRLFRRVFQDRKGLCGSIAGPRVTTASYETSADPWLW